MKFQKWMRRVIPILLVLAVCSARAGIATAFSEAFTLDTIDSGAVPTRLDASVVGYSDLFTVDTGAMVFASERSDLFTVDTRETFSVCAVTTLFSNPGRRGVFLHGVSLDMTFTVEVDWNGRTPGKVQFRLPSGVLVSETWPTNSHTFDVGADFGVGGRLSARAVDSDGDPTAWLDANIEIAPVPPALLPALLTPKISGSTLRYELINIGSFGMTVYDDNAPTVPEDIPLFGGNGFGFDHLFPDLGVDVSSGGTANYWVSQEGPEETKLKLGNMALDTSLTGGLDWIYDEGAGSWPLEDGYLTADIFVETEWGPQYWVIPSPLMPVPAYYRASIGASLTDTLTVAGFSDDRWLLAGLLGPEVFGEITGGVGIADALASEVYLGIAAGLDFSFPADEPLQDAYVSFSGGVRVVVLVWKWSNEIFEYNWRLSDGRTGKILELPDFRNDPGQLLPRTYLSMRRTDRVDGQDASGEEPGVGFPGTREAVPGGTETTLATSVFPYAQPVLALNTDELMLLWVGDDGTRSDTNRTKLFSRTWTAAAGWSADVAVEDNGTADFAPTLAASTTGFVAGWEDFGTVLSEDAVLDDMLAAEEISVSDYDVTTDTWSSAVSLTDNTVVDHVPCIAAADDAALAVWVRNDSNDLLGTPGMPNTLVYSHRPAGGSWSAPADFATGVAGIVKADLAFDGTQGIYVFIVDADGDLSSDSDQELYRADFAAATGWQPPVRLTDNTLEDTNPQLLTDANGDLCLFWYRGGEIMLARAADLSDQMVAATTDGASGSSDFRACISPFGQIALVYASASPEGQDLYAAVHDTAHDSWGTPQQLTADLAMERSVTAAYTDDGTLVTVYNKIPMVPELRMVDVGGKQVEVEVPVPDMTNVSLCSLTRTIAGDLTVSDIRFDPDNPVPGTQVAISAAVGNVGDLAATDVTVKFYNGDPERRAELIGEVIVAGTFASGTSADVSVDWTVPADADQGLSIFAVVDPGVGYNERDTDNNIASAGFLLPDLVMESLYLETVGPSNYVARVRVVNDGVIPVEDVPLVLRQNDLNGSLLAQRMVSLDPGANVDLSFAVASTNRADGDLLVFALIDPDDLTVEVSELNNSRTARGQRAAVALPEILPVSGTYATDVDVTISCPTPGSTIYYTLNGTDPEETETLYAGSFPIATYTVVRARAYAANLDPSPIAETTYAFVAENHPPRIDAVHAEPIADEQLSVTLVSEAADPDDGPQPLTYAWTLVTREGTVEFGDTNGTTTGTSVTATFSEPGTYDLLLTVSDGEDAETAPLEVEVLNHPPVADPGGPYVIAEGQPLELDGSASTDPDEGCGDSIVIYEWDLDNDGGFDNAAGAGPVVPWADLDVLGLQLAAGATGLPVNTIRLRVTDSLGLETVGETTVTVYKHEWAFAVSVEGGSVSELNFGMTAGATDSSDDVLDEQPAAAGRNGLPATFLRGRDGVLLQCDVRDVSDCAIWLAEIRADVGDDIVLSWSAADVPANGLRLVEVDEAGEVLAGGSRLDMSVDESLRVLQGTARFFLIVYGERNTDLTLEPGWNLVSFPFDLWEANAGEIFDGLDVVSPVYGWTDGGYVSIQPGTPLYARHGYWVFLASNTRGANLTFAGFPCWNEVTFVSPRAWSLLGPLNECVRSTGEETMSLWQWKAQTQQYAPINAGETIPLGSGLWFIFVNPHEEQFLDLTSFQFLSSGE